MKSTQEWYFEQDGASSHYCLVMRTCLDGILVNKWLGRKRINRDNIPPPTRSTDLKAIQDCLSTGEVPDTTLPQNTIVVQSLKDLGIEVSPDNLHLYHGKAVLPEGGRQGRSAHRRREERKKPKNNEIEDCHTWHNAGWREKPKKQKNKEIADCQTWHNVARREEPKKSEEQRNSRLSDMAQRSQERRAKEIRRTKEWSIGKTRRVT
ncbi:hypothetical protein AVEN_234562-1 [Araneus ventricosus]|uniref:Uncharacterized protein n=1 Tax=Araneus ventricosus TaxID=182803 RepID=A0A4Y2A982_ARAVE|nr:hypothetical protein AVEN_234562-1 [Araneus ventricosus]